MKRRELARPRTGTDVADDSRSGISWAAWIDDSCRMVEAAGQWRRPKEFDALGPSGLLGAATGSVDPVPVVSFASNDYLGLASHPEVVKAAHEALDRWGTGSGASRLVTGSRPVHRELEEALASWKACEQAVVLPTGFAANLSVLSVFGSKDAHIFSDELNHASIIDGCRMASAGVTVYPHSDLDSLDRALHRTSGRPIIVSDTVFSMDGDAADLDALAEVACRHEALLVLDEAHAVLGPELSSQPINKANILRVGTLSKTLGSLGGFVAGSARSVDLLVNLARPYIFTTALSPADTAAALAAVNVISSPEGSALCARLSDYVRRVSAVLRRDPNQSPIIAVIIGDELDAVAASSALLDRGLWVPAIRPPTVPPGTSRLRITVSAVHTDEQVEKLTSALVELGLVPNENL